MNKDLYNSSLGVVEIPDSIKNHLTICFAKVKNADKNTKGYNRNLQLQNQKQIDYKQLKRIKNFFDNFEGEFDDPSWILNGEGVMKGWVENCLKLMRDNVKKNMDNEVENSKISHSDLKNDTSSLLRPSQQHKKTSERHVTSVFESEVLQSLKRINELITKI